MNINHYFPVYIYRTIWYVNVLFYDLFSVDINFVHDCEAISASSHQVYSNHAITLTFYHVNVK